MDFKKMFYPETKPLLHMFNVDNHGFIIPSYQRDYSWDTENIDQLLEDVTIGVRNMLNDEDEIRFLGTVIIVPHHEYAQVPVRPRSLETIVDGQQRISTVALLGALLYQRLVQLLQELPTDPPYWKDFAENLCESRLKELQKSFSFDLTYGRPKRKPKIIRAVDDSWTESGVDHKHYRSDVAAYLASVIRAIDEESSFPDLPPNKSLVGRSLRRLISYLRNNVETAHRSEELQEEYPAAHQIMSSSKLKQSDIWVHHDRPELIEILCNGQDSSPARDTLCSIVQLLAFSYYLFERCCFTVIVAEQEEWAFDLFQSLNATGTPLTAIETFKPVVERAANDTAPLFAEEIQEHFSKVEALFGEARTANQKNTLTNNYLTGFALIYDGKKLSRKFSEQRRWLNSTFRRCTTNESQEEYVRRMADHAAYIRVADSLESNVLPGLEDSSDNELATFCIAYLQDAGHRMASNVFSRFYAEIMRGRENAADEFVEAVRGVTAFFTIWRSAYGTSGLDDVYRLLFRGDSNQEVQAISWEGSVQKVSASNVKHYLREVLKGKKNISSKEDWLNSATQNLNYEDVRAICRFALFIAAEYGIPDPKRPGLITMGKKLITSSYLTTKMWNCDELRTIEHVAPQERTGGWDEEIYEGLNRHRIGNLTLLPTHINASAANRDWIAKWIYYSHLSEQNPEQLVPLAEIAAKYNVELQQNTISLLQDASYSDHMRSIVQVGPDGLWNMELINARSTSICSLLWDVLWPWLS